VPFIPDPLPPKILQEVRALKVRDQKVRVLKEIRALPKAQHAIAQTDADQYEFLTVDHEEAQGLFGREKLPLVPIPTADSTGTKPAIPVVSNHTKFPTNPCTILFDILLTSTHFTHPSRPRRF
jgi:hypothetical protein